MDHAGGGDDLVGRVSLKIQQRNGPHHFQGQRPDVDAGEEPLHIWIMQVQLDPSELLQFGQLPEDNR